MQSTGTGWQLPVPVAAARLAAAAVRPAAARADVGCRCRRGREAAPSDLDLQTSVSARVCGARGVCACLAACHDDGPCLLCPYPAVCPCKCSDPTIISRTIMT